MKSAKSEAEYEEAFKTGDNKIEITKLPRRSTTTTTKITAHECRPWRLKYRLRDKSKDLAALVSILDKTKTSLNLIYPQYLTERNHNVSFEVKAQTSLDHFEETSAEK